VIRLFFRFEVGCVRFSSSIRFCAIVGILAGVSVLGSGMVWDFYMYSIGLLTFWCVDRFVIGSLSLCPFLGYLFSGFCWALGSWWFSFVLMYVFLKRLDFVCLVLLE